MIPLDLFERNMAKLSSFFGKKLSSEQVLLYYDQLKDIPAEPFVDIVDGLISTHRPSPGNFPSIDDLKSGWWDWVRTHPERVHEDKSTWCDECGGRGYIEVWYKSKKVKGFVADGNMIPCWANAIVPCAMCDNYKHVFATKLYRRRWIKEELLKQGYLLHNPYWQGLKPYGVFDWKLDEIPRLIDEQRDNSDFQSRDVEDLASSFFDNIPF